MNLYVYKVQFTKTCNNGNEKTFTKTITRFSNTTEPDFIECIYSFASNKRYYNIKILECKKA